jgi:hypothetical protein
MSKPKTKIYEILDLIRQHGPVSANRLTELTGDLRQSIDKYVRQAHDAGLIHIATFGPSPLGGNRTVKLYMVGKAVDAQRTAKAQPKKVVLHQQDDASRKGMNFSGREKRIIREIKKSGQPVKTQMHRLPGRTFYGVQRAVAAIKGKKKREVGSWIWVAVVNILRESPSLSVRDISERIGCSSRQTMNLMNENHGHGVYISGWEIICRTLAAQWSLGSRNDEPKPASPSIEERRRKARVRYHRRLAAAKQNPFATALGLVKAPANGSGRVYQQSMNSEDEYREAA